MAELRHYLLTRFNAALYSGGAALPVCPEDWMQHRIRLFLSVTLPSIMGQRCQRFTWLILMDRQTPQRYIRMLEEARYPNLRIIYPVAGQNPWLQDLPSGQYDLMTTRIDNDDAFHQDAIEILQATWRAEHTRRSKPWVIVFPFGLIMDLPGRQAWLMEYWRNNCPTLVDDSRQPHTIWQWDHSDIPQDVDTCHIKDKPYWLQIVHSQNLRNALHSENPDRIVHNELPARPEHLRHFNIDVGALPTA